MVAGTQTMGLLQHSQGAGAELAKDTASRDEP